MAELNVRPFELKAFPNEERNKKRRTESEIEKRADNIHCDKWDTYSTYGGRAVLAEVPLEASKPGERERKKIAEFMKVIL